MVDALERKEYTVLICDRVANSYLMDLYALYRGKSPPHTPALFVRSITTMNVEKVVDPEKWFHCLQWTRYRRQGNESSMEWFVARPTYSMFYYSLGEDGALLVPRDSSMKMIEIHAETVKAIAGFSSVYCKNPILKIVDTEKCVFPLND